MRRRRSYLRILVDAVVAFGLLLGLWLLVSPATRYALQLSAMPRPAHLAVPVRGVPARGLADTGNAPGSGGRHHEGIDIFAPAETPITSPVQGIVLGVGWNSLGGRVVRVLGPGRQVHYFAHLSRFGPVNRGMRIPAGEVLGYVGTTGNARGTPPHLHYGIYNLPGGATNPYPVLARR